MKTVAIVGAGEMGVAVAKRLADAGCSVVVSVEGRSDASRRRVAALGVTAAHSMHEVITHGDLVLSIVPPGEALSVASAAAAALRAAPRAPTYVDCNAVSPETVHEIASIVGSAGASFVDAGIIGAPPHPGTAGPIIFISGEPIAPVIALREAGLDVRALGSTPGCASALKMSYAGVTKGITALCALMQFHARKHDLGAELNAVLQETRPDLWQFLEGAVPSMYPKAYRWVAEMREIAAYAAADEAAASIYEGAAQFYERVARENAERAT